MNTGTIFAYINGIAPFSTAESWDNPGLLAGNMSDTVTQVLVSLDITPAVVEEAHDMGAELIVSHHPVIFEPLMHLEPASAPYLLAKYGIGAICAHTNLDKAVGGVNDLLARAAGIEGELEWLSETGEQAVGRVGSLAKSMTIENYAKFIKKALNANVVRVCEGSGIVSRVAVVGGSGGDYVRLAKALGADTLLTGDVKYHEFLLAAELSVNLIDAGHFATENLVVPRLIALMNKEFPQLKIMLSQHTDIIKGI